MRPWPLPVGLLRVAWPVAATFPQRLRALAWPWLRPSALRSSVTMPARLHRCRQRFRPQLGLEVLPFAAPRHSGAPSAKASATRSAKLGCSGHGRFLRGTDFIQVTLRPLTAACSSLSSEVLRMDSMCEILSLCCLVAGFARPVEMRPPHSRDGALPAPHRRGIRRIAVRCRNWLARRQSD